MADGIWYPHSMNEDTICMVCGELIPAYQTYGCVGTTNKEVKAICQTCIEVAYKECVWRNDVYPDLMRANVEGYNSDLQNILKKMERK